MERDIVRQYAEFALKRAKKNLIKNNFYIDKIIVGCVYLGVGLAEKTPKVLFDSKKLK